LAIVGGRPRVPRSRLVLAEGCRPSALSVAYAVRVIGAWSSTAGAGFCHRGGAPASDGSAILL